MNLTKEQREAIEFGMRALNERYPVRCAKEIVTLRSLLDAPSADDAGPDEPVAWLLENPPALRGAANISTLTRSHQIAERHNGKPLYLRPAPTPEDAPSTAQGAVVTLERTIEQWRNCDPLIMQHMSPAAIYFALRDAKHDILALHAELERSDRRDGVKE